MGLQRVVCRISKKSFEVDETFDFLLRRMVELNPVLGDAPLPLPTVHPFETLRRVYSFGSLRHLFKSESCISGVSQLTRYNPMYGTRICTTDEFYSDSVDNVQEGRPYDFQQEFFPQWGELLYRVILPPLNRTNCEDSEYVNGAQDLKSCYLCFGTFRCRDCLYCFYVSDSTDCVDCVNCRNCELCYASHDLIRCYRADTSRDCIDGYELFGCHDCRSCKYCFGCVGLEHAEYNIFNTPCSPEYYQSFIAEKSLHSFVAREAAVAECDEFASTLDHSFNSILQCSNATGAYLSRCENVVHCYNGSALTDCGYLIGLSNSHYCYVSLGENSEFCYLAHSLGSSKNAFCYTIFAGEANTYSAFLYNCSHCFGCIALRNKSYCILNKQYTRESYEEIVPRVVEQMRRSGAWGEWFPLELSPHSYQESLVDDFLRPIPLAVAAERGYRVFEEQGNDQHLAEPQSTAPLPDTFDKDDIDSLLAMSLLCKHSGKRFRFQRTELEFYVRLGIPVPRLHWDTRIRQLNEQRELIPAI